MTFLNPFAWLAAVAAAVPLVVHLLSRRKARREAFPSIRFLGQVHRQEVRRLRLREWLLLLLRTLAVTAMALAFARPAIQGSFGAASHAPTSIVALVDRSLSMRASGPQGSRFKEAASRLRELANLIEPGSEVQLLAFDVHAAPLFEDFIHDPARFRAAAASLQPGYAGTDLGASLREGARWLKNRPGLRREMFVISDFQATGMDSAGAPDAPASAGASLQGIDVYFVPVAAKETSNAAWVSAEATRVGAGGEIDAVVRNASDEARKGALLEARTGSRLLGAARTDLPPRADTRVRIPVTGLTATDFGAVLSLPHDVLEEDDHIAVAIPGARPLSVLLVGAENSRTYVDAALKAAPDAFAVAASEDGSGAEPADVWVLLDPDRINASALRAHLVRGGGVLAVEGEGAMSHRIENALGDASPAAAMEIVGDTTGGAFDELRVLDPGHPSFRDLAERRGTALSGARFHRSVRLRPAAGASVPAEFAPDRPALVECGRVIEFASTLDGEWNDLVFSPSFVPWLYQTLEHLASRPRPAGVPVGERWVRELPAEWKALPLRLTTPDGGTVPVDVTQGGTEVRSERLAVPGLYTLEAAGRPVEAVACVAPAAESDIRAMSAERIQALDPQALRVQGSLQEAVQRRRHGRELWREFLLAALILFVAESVVARLTVASRA